MTPTPEEVKDRVAVRHGYENWRQLVFLFMNSADSRDEGTLSEYENEAMHEYAEALYKDKIEKSENELPDIDAFKDWHFDNYDENKNLDYSYAAYEWMKQAASVVIATKDKQIKQLEIDNYHKEANLEQCNILLEQKDKELIAEAHRMYDMVIEFQQKDKEIEELKERCERTCNLYKK